MMDVFLKITGNTKTEPEQTTDTTEMLTRGTFYRNHGCLYFFYDGADEETPELITNHRITVKDRRVEVQRRGAIDTRMIIAPGELNQSDYATPFGILRLDFYGHSVDVTEAESFLRVNMKYEIRIDGTVVSTNELFLEATPVEEGTTMFLRTNGETEQQEEETAL